LDDKFRRRSRQRIYCHPLDDKVCPCARAGLQGSDEFPLLYPSRRLRW
jgi:hypothetical protein